MILISHRGNLSGRIESRENSPDYIEEAASLGFFVEIDLWLIESELYLGHDLPVYKIDIDWLKSRSKYLWIHCKNIESIILLNSIDFEFNYFWHQSDTVTLTSKNFIWAYPGNQPIENSIAVMPELGNEDISSCLGICSDHISLYKK